MIWGKEKVFEKGKMRKERENLVENVRDIEKWEEIIEKFEKKRW